LIAEAGSAEEAMLAIPPRLWFGTLAMVIRMFHGAVGRQPLPRPWGCAGGRGPEGL